MAVARVACAKRGRGVAEIGPRRGGRSSAPCSSRSSGKVPSSRRTITSIAALPWKRQGRVRAAPARRRIARRPRIPRPAARYAGKLRISARCCFRRPSRLPRRRRSHSVRRRCDCPASPSSNLREPRAAGRLHRRSRPRGSGPPRYGAGARRALASSSLPRKTKVLGV